LEFAEARFYNPLHGRFTSVDPLTASATIRNPQTLNRHSYVLNSQYNFTDPLGLFPANKNSRCNFECRVMAATYFGGTLRPADRDLAAFHIISGSALGYMLLNASYNEIYRQNQSTASAATQQPNSGMSMSADGRAMLAADGMEGRKEFPYDKDGAIGVGNCTVGV
jgi:hypothetical protein